MEVPTEAPRQPSVVDELGVTVQRDFLHFLSEFQTEDEQPVYAEAVEQMRLNETTTLYVDFAHVSEHSQILAASIEEEYFRMEPYLREAVRQFVETVSLPNAPNDDRDIKDYFIAFHNLLGTVPIRHLKTARIGTLISIRGTVVRTSAVHPELVSGTFQCNECQAVVENVEQQFKYTQPTRCRNPVCVNTKDFKLLLERSKFVDFQKIRVQESSDEIPSGSMPRSMDIILRHEAVEKAKPGDKSCFMGSLVVVPDVSQLATPGQKTQLSSSGSQRAAEGYGSDGLTGLKALGVRDLTYKLAFLGQMVQPLDHKMDQINIREEEATTESVISQFSEPERQRILEMKGDPDLYKKLSRSIAPAVFGHEEVKRGIALMLFGGVHKNTSDGIGLRGDINTCIVGDPSTSKSQFLKYVVEFVPRAVYTSGRASSAAGLTAAVVRDEDSNEFYIEAGALMLADNGICCIDEFDKMEMRDQVAIHEAMEQQTISITKAGIQATLNARTSILAAANPINGRYDKGKTLKSNVAMTAPIMSRFDLFFVIVDECNEVSDYNIAKHITNVHRKKDAALNPDFSSHELQNYIRFARTLKPRITPAAKQAMVRRYIELRDEDKNGLSKSSYRITVRQLESLIRLSEARARLDCSDEITVHHVQQACQLLQRSIINVETDDITLTGEENEMEAEIPDPADLGDQDAEDEAPEGSVPRKATTISFEKYQSIARQLVERLREVENAQLAAQPEGADEDEDGVDGLTKKDLVGWYLEQHADEFADQEALLEEVRVVRLVINRLVNVDGVLLELHAEAEEGDVEDEMHHIVVHPNYVDE